MCNENVTFSGSHVLERSECARTGRNADGHWIAPDRFLPRHGCNTIIHLKPARRCYTTHDRGCYLTRKCTYTYNMYTVYTRSYVISYIPRRYIILLYLGVHSAARTHELKFNAHEGVVLM